MNEEPGGDLLSQEVNSLSSARLRFTVLFEMGRGGSEVLWPPSITCCLGAGMNPGREAKTGKKVKISCNCNTEFSIAQGYRIKPHGQLVSVSLTHYCASTPDLSTLWSSTTLQGDQVPREILSQGEFHA